MKKTIIFIVILMDKTVSVGQSMHYDARLIVGGFSCGTGENQSMATKTRGKRKLDYRVTHLLANLGWVDFDLGCSTLCLVLPGLMGNWQSWLSSWARWGNIPNQSQPNPGSPGYG